MKILSIGWRHPWRFRNRFWSGQTWKFKMADCCDLSAEEVLEKMESIFKSALCVMVSDDFSRLFLLISFNAVLKSLPVDVIMSVAVAVGMMSLWGNQKTFCLMQNELMEYIQI